MASTNKTDYLGLSQYLGIDTQEMEDVNSDNSIIDAALRSLNENKADKASLAFEDLPNVESLLNLSWIRFATSYGCRIYKQGNIVYCDLLIKPSTTPNINTNQTLLTLPMGWRPVTRSIFGASFYGVKSGTIGFYLVSADINTDGSLTISLDHSTAMPTSVTYLTLQFSYRI